MPLELNYTNDDARRTSQKGNPIPLYAYQNQGIHFAKGLSVRVSSNTHLRFFAGFTITALPKDTIGLIVPVTNLNCPTLTLVSGSYIANLNTPIYMDMICHSGFTIIDYGQYLANLYIIPVTPLELLR